MSSLNIAELVGKDLGKSAWFIVDQDRIRQFAEVTEDHQWIHIDEARAKAESPYGTTIAHGFLTLSLLSKFAFELRNFPAGVTVINYGLDKVRFLNAVKVGSRIRNHAVIVAADPNGEGRTLLKTKNTVEIEGEENPAMIAETLSLILH
ncbi:MAG: MaoC family dehydratase [Trueperaceae bacterium]|nr:MaoC family dehydratase [Trueperaceae bacterium]